jgi:hypothetical protein
MIRRRHLAALRRLTMKYSLMILAAALAFAGAAGAVEDHAVKGYVKKDGTVVAPTIATNPNATKFDNYSTKGNVNPSTGKEGTVDPYKVTPIKPLK